MTEGTIAELLTRVKIRREAKKVERENEITHPQYHARCLDCEWAWAPAVQPSTVQLARAQSRVHAKAHGRDRGHRAQSVFDVVDQVDETFMPPTLVELGRDVAQGCDVPMGELELCGEAIYCINCSACEAHCRCGDPVRLDDLMADTTKGVSR